ncbi:MAG TPA: hypothetical protein VF807_07980 [Ktedonobacterales bacterium]
MKLGLIVVGIICVLIGVYYLIPGINHVLASPPAEIHVKHALVFFAAAVVAFIGSRFVGARN